MSTGKTRAVRSAATPGGLPFARRIRDLRKRLKLSQQKFADDLGVTRLAASRWQNGDAEPSATNFLILAKLAQERGYFDLALKFWESAGMTVPLLRALIPEFEEFATRHERRTFELPLDQEIVRLPLLDNSFFEGGEGDLVAVECPFEIPAQRPKTSRIGDEPIVAAFFEPTMGTSLVPEQRGLYLRRLLLRGLDVTNIFLESELGLRLAAARASHLIIEPELSGIEFREFIHSETLNITGNVHGLPGRPEPEWSILGRVIASVTSHPGNPDGDESAGRENP